MHEISVSASIKIIFEIVKSHNVTPLTALKPISTFLF